MITKRYVDTRDGQLHCRQCGSGRPLLLLQILPFSTQMYEALMEDLAGRGFAVTAIDMLGYGRSDPRPEVWMPQAFAKNLLEALDNLGLSEPIDILCGHFTGMVATAFTLEWPARARRLIIDGFVGLDRASMAKHAAATTVPRPPPWDEEGVNLLAFWHQAVRLMKLLNPELEFTAKNEPDIAEKFFSHVRAYYGAGPTVGMFNYDMVAEAKKLTLPVLLITSPTDTLAAWHHAAMEAVPHAQAHVFEEVNPVFREDRPELISSYGSVISSFLNSI